MKKILTGNEAIEAYTEISTSSMVSEMPKVAGYFNADDCEETKLFMFDKGTIFAFDNRKGENYHMEFDTKEEAFKWCND